MRDTLQVNQKISSMLFCLIAVISAHAQFYDNFDAPNLSLDPSAYKGWAFYSGDGNAGIEMTQKSGYAVIKVDARKDIRNIWWALIRRHAEGIDSELLSKPEYELRVETRIRVSHAPRRVNLHCNTQRTTDFYLHLMEYDIPDTVNWHTISMTTRDFEVLPGDTIYAQLALMDWGLGEYHVDMDYFKVDVVRTDTLTGDLGSQMLYHPPVPKTTIFQNHIPVLHDATVDPLFPDVNFNDWSIQQDTSSIPILSVGATQFVILRWDFTEFFGLRATESGLLEITTFTLQRKLEKQKDFGIVRVVEILGGDPYWKQEQVTYYSLLGTGKINEVLNSQMIIDVEVTGARNGKTFATISRPVLQRMIEGKTQGLAIIPLGAIHASFYASENRNDEFIPKLHFSIE